MNNKISAIILTKNEEKNIKDCINALSWVDKIVVLDDNSQDKTTGIAEKLGAQVLIHNLNNDFAAQRNFGLEKAHNEWVLFIDADERVSLSLQYEITHLINDPMNSNNGYYISRVDMIWGKKISYGESAHNKFLRLGKRTEGKWVGKVHETWDIKGTTGLLKNPLLHFPHQTLQEFLTKINVYTDLRAQELFEKKVKSYWVHIVCYPIGKFLYTYIVLQGFLDGTQGLLIALTMSFHSFLVRSKLWFLWQKK